MLLKCINLPDYSPYILQLKYVCFHVFVICLCNECIGQSQDNRMHPRTRLTHFNVPDGGSKLTDMQGGNLSYLPLMRRVMYASCMPTIGFSQKIAMIYSTLINSRDRSNIKETHTNSDLNLWKKLTIWQCGQDGWKMNKYSLGVACDLYRITINLPHVLIYAW